MSDVSIRQRSLPLIGPTDLEYPASGKVAKYASVKRAVLASGKQKTVSEGHPMNRSDGSYRSGGPFFTSRVTPILESGGVRDAYNWSKGYFYSGPVFGAAVSLAEMDSVGFKNVGLNLGSSNDAQMEKDGATAISLVSPTNPAANLGVTLGESMRDGIPSIPGMSTWKSRTKTLKNLGDEYLNYVFGWAPLVKEVNNTVSAARHHRDIMKQYRKGEGSDNHRRFDFPSQKASSSWETTSWPVFPLGGWFHLNSGAPRRTISLVKETKRWFEGCFTYALPSSTDNWRRAYGFGSEADHLFGLTLTPDVLWELTPWSWAIDWFSNAGNVITNVTNFGLAGLVMRYGYIMEESIERITAEGGSAVMTSTSVSKPGSTETTVRSGSWERGYEIVTKRRLPANPFGFGIGWEGLSPTQLAITAALGITKFGSRSL